MIWGVGVVIFIHLRFFSLSHDYLLRLCVCVCVLFFFWGERSKNSSIYFGIMPEYS